MQLPIVAFLFRRKTSDGFTLVELLITFALTVTLSALAVAGYVQFSRNRVIDSAVYDVAAMLEKAKSRAQSQVKPTSIASCATGALGGYQVRICGVPGSTCGTIGVYQLRILCGATLTIVESKTLPSGATFGNSTSPSFFFQVMNGSVTPGSVFITNGSWSKNIQVSGLGTIRVQ